MVMAVVARTNDHAPRLRSSSISPTGGGETPTCASRSACFVMLEFTDTIVGEPGLESIVMIIGRNNKLEAGDRVRESGGLSV
jgi:hypothetical protein